MTELPAADPGETMRGAGELVADRFRIRRLLGAGGMGCVYEAEHIHLGRRVALKFLRRAERDDGGLERFEREARAAGALDNDHVVQVFDFGYTEAGAPYLAMELLEGQSLGALLREGPLPVARAADLVAQACRGLHDAHEAGLVHRDLKPENLFVTRRADGTDLLKVLDFGVVQVRGVPDRPVDAEGESWGTPAYMSPEQARCEADLDRRSDVYALGAVLFECLAGRPAFDASTAEATIVQILTQRPPPVSRFRTGVPRSLERVVLQAMAHTPNGRFATAWSMAQALEPFARAVAPRPSANAATADAQVITTRSGAGRQLATGRRRQFRIRFAAVGVAVLSMAAVWTLRVRQQAAPASDRAAPIDARAPASRLGIEAPSSAATSPSPPSTVQAAPMSSFRSPDHGRLASPPSERPRLAGEPWVHRPSSRRRAPAQGSVPQPLSDGRAGLPANPARELQTEAPAAVVPHRATFERTNPYDSTP